MSNEIDDFLESIPVGRCKGCRYAKTVFANGEYMFLGCYHAPYRGRRVAEIKICPKDLIDRWGSGTDVKTSAAI